MFLRRKEECWILFLQGPFNKAKTLISNLNTGLVIICDVENDIIKMGIVSWRQRAEVRGGWWRANREALILV